ncbi:nucleotide exchange factor GrpE [Candidatus Woesebacteria bacterium]|nr:nucleotide exchange factor GrpE [Candidatus Woesebacteria bacterium]
MSHTKQSQTIDPEEVQDAAVDATAVIEQLNEKIEALEEEIGQAKNGALRAQADYQNLQRRNREEFSTMAKLATSGLVGDMLEPLEHLSMTAEQVKSPVLDMVINQLWAVLKTHGIQEIEVLGQPYDVALMEVVDIIDDATESDGVIVKVIKRGYTLNGQVLQHAKVVIGKKS